jgi:hypothetical protein
VIDVTTFSNRSKYAAEINAGYSARLNSAALGTNPHLVWVDSDDELEPRKLQPLSDKGHAWQHGWWLADKDQKRGAR